MKHNALLQAYPEAEQNLTQFANWLADQGVVRGLLGPREVDRIWDRHLANCAVIAELIPRGASLIDIGSGAGLPGLVVAIVRPDVQCTLIEPLLRRTEFLQEVVDDLGLSNVSIRRGRAEQVTDLQADVVTARAVAPLGKLLGWALPLMKNNGQILAMKGQSAAVEIEEAADLLNGYSAQLIAVGQGIVDPPTTIVQVKKLS